jgi:hypothetical protein
LNVVVSLVLPFDRKYVPAVGHTGTEFKSVSEPAAESAEDISMADELFEIIEV